MHELINDLQTKQLIWKGNRHQAPSQYHTTGFSELDQQLQGGFPTSGVVEIQALSGIGELRLLTPFIAQQAKQRLCVLINPPGYVCAEYLYAQGISPSQVLLVYPTSEAHALWAAEQSLKSGASCTVCLWQNDIEIHQAKRLQVASDVGHCPLFLLKPNAEQAQKVFSLPVSLSLTLHPHPSGIEVNITKRKGGFPRASFVIDMSQYWPELASVNKPPANNVLAFPLLQQG
ncbi:translesion DNA synthesis-associated protein ImuA [Vibrio hippocampi]|uniref:Recombinase RecA n=1 Tax=Vibrio hippocampi TaxID=654686 RepID=A0ABM8ZI79_9VIBR|nr:translesion DNA synthesis-associated protein ImuA [Vibrio hippocampi]CAH0526517.1 hypothetical protein VHP8226_01871 [Vibrio hippocampi]